MKCLIERVTSAQLTCPEKKAQINRGLLVYVGFTHGDTLTTVQTMRDKLVGLRVFEDEKGKLNLDLNAVDGAFLLVPAFTLYADAKNARRPSLSGALAYAEASALFDALVDMLNPAVRLSTGVFGADMQITSTNDGPITLILEVNA